MEGLRSDDNMRVSLSLSIAMLEPRGHSNCGTQDRRLGASSWLSFLTFISPTYGVTLLDSRPCPIASSLLTNSRCRRRISLSMLCRHHPIQTEAETRASPNKDPCSLQRKHGITTIRWKHPSVPCRLGLIFHSSANRWSIVDTWKTQQAEARHQSWIPWASASPSQSSIFSWLDIGQQSFLVAMARATPSTFSSSQDTGARTG